MGKEKEVRFSGRVSPSRWPCPFGLGRRASGHALQVLPTCLPCLPVCLRGGWVVGGWSEWMARKEPWPEPARSAHRQSRYRLYALRQVSYSGQWMLGSSLSLVGRKHAHGRSRSTVL